MISTHVLDTWAGIPAAGVRVTLERQAGEKWVAIGEAQTDADGRVKEMLAAAAPRQVGIYRMRYATGDYFESRGVAAFHPSVTVEFDVRDASAHHHVPLLLGPYSYTTYRGKREARMSATLEWTNLIIRVFHVVAGIGWIGSSFFFVWLDRHLEAPSREPGSDPRVDGDLWMVHSGGFYHMQKRRLGPGELPATLHWVKWEATLSWASGIVLLAVVYYLTGGAYLLDASISSLTLVGALAYSVFFLALAWVAYDQLWKSAFGRAGWPAALVSFAVLGALILVAFRSLSGRAAAIHIGTLLGTLMVANVWAVIIPSQQTMVDATAKGIEPDQKLGAQAKLRSMHNSYMTFPLLFLMVSSHFPETYSGRFGWAVLLLICIAGALARHVMIGRPLFGLHKGWAVVPAVAALAGAMLIVRGPSTVSPPPSAVGTAAGSFAEARVVIAQRCASCHSSAPTDSIFRAAPNGVAFDTPQQIRALSARILERAVVQKTMPFANRTGITAAEREVLRRWIEAGAPLR